MFILLQNRLLPQSPIDSLEIYDIYTQADEIRLILKNYFSILGDDNKLLINKLRKEAENGRKKNLLSLESEALIKSADIYMRGGLYDHALDNYYIALKNLESTGDSIKAAMVEIKIGRAYYFADLWSNLDYIGLGYHKLLKSKNIEDVAFALYAGGTIEKDPAKQAELYNRALEIQKELAKKKPDDFETNSRLSRYLNAAGHLEEAIKVAEKIGDDWLLVLYLNNLGYKKVLAGNYNESLPFFYRSLSICKAKRFKTLLRNTYDNIARAYRLMGDNKKAVYYYLYMHFVEESLYTERFAIQTSDSRVKYETEKKNLENEYLKREKNILAKSIEIKQLQNISLIFLVVVISFISVYIYLSRKKIKAASILLDRQNNEITSQKERLEALNSELSLSEENLKTAQSTAHLANWEWDFKHDVLSFSDELPKIYGIDKEKLMLNFRQTIYDTIHPDDKDQYRIYYDDFNHFRNEEKEYRIIVNGAIKWIRANRIAVKNSAGDVIRIFGTVQDVTEMKEEEEIKVQMAAQQSFTRQLIESQEEERKRIAGELHDSVGQDILLIKNRTQLALQNEGIDSFTREQLFEINKSTSDTLRMVREISFNLRPAHLERLGLTETIISAIQKMRDISGINFSHNIENIDNLLAKDMEINFYRIIQEGLNNIVKHSEASSARIEIYKKEDVLFLSISDDGKGFEVKTKASSTGGFGINNILSRVKMLNGTLDIISEPSKGTELRIEVQAKYK